MKQTAEKTVVAKILTDELTNKKRDALEREYTAFQRYIRGDEDVDLYSATEQCADAYVEKEKVKDDHEYPWFIRNDTFHVDLRRDDNDVADWWLKVPVAKVRGGINVPIKPHDEIPEESEVKDSKIVRDDGEYYAHLTIRKEVEVREKYDGVIGVDFGVRWVATSVALPSRNTTFYGEAIRQKRRHYSELRTRLQEKGAYDTLQQTKEKEARFVEDRLHKISRSIVEEAKERDAFIVVGDLEGIDEEDKGSEMNRRLSTMPHYKLKQFIKYKAKFEGITVVEVDEYMTSKTCSKCGNMETKTDRQGQGRFMCDECGLEDNADKNGAVNIAKRGLGKSIERPPSSLGVSVNTPERCFNDSTAGTVLSGREDIETPTSTSEA